MMNGMGISDIGRVRMRNEDSIFVSNEPIGALSNLYIVADGMGGHKAGDVASSMAIDAFCRYVKCAEQGEEPLDILIGAANSANSEVYEMAKAHEECSNMGSTIVACSISDNNAYIAHIGDSRLYKLADNIEQITSDHSLVAELVKAGVITEAEARVHPQRNTITRALGTESSVVADGIILPIADGDKLLMCSDGLSGMLTDEEIKAIADLDESLDKRLENLVAEANEKGGADNISAIIIEA